MPYEQAKKYGDRTVFEYKDFGGTVWKKVSWRDFAANVRRVSLAMLAMGVKVQENIGVFSQNSLPYIYTDFGAFGVRAVTIPFYATSSEQQLQYVINDAQIRFFFVGEQEQYDKARRVQALCPTLERIVIYDQSVALAEHDTTSVYFRDFIEEGKDESEDKLNSLLSSICGDDIANILYTSGTTGDSKGVVLTHGQYMAAFKANDKCVPVGEDDRVITFLPITHIFERGWDFLALTEGATIIINTDPHEIQKSMRETHPTCMSAVPRFWEKVYAGVQEKINTSSPIQRKMLEDALRVGKEYNVNYKMKGLEPPLTLKMQYLFYEKTVIALLLKMLGLERHNFFPTAGAAISKEVEEFIHSAGIMMIVGYGLTESTATVSADRWNRPITIGSVGRLLDGVQLKFDENNEILLKGDTITKGYYRKAEVT